MTIDSTDSTVRTYSLALLLIGALLFTRLFLPCFSWLAGMLLQGEYRLNSLLLAALFLFTIKKLDYRQLSAISFQYRHLSWGLFVTGILGFLYTERYLDIDLFSCMFMAISGAGFAGFFLGDSQWRRVIPFFALFILVLPFSYHLETFIGFPLRIFAAKTAHQLLQSIGIDAVTQESIILIENRLAHIDLPCSGLKSLWIGTLFFIFLSTLEHYRFSLRWGACLLFSLLIMVVANIFRILSLVALHLSALPHIIKETLHIPIGLIGFVISCALIYLVANRLDKHEGDKPEIQRRRFQASFAWVFTGIMMAALFMYQTQPYPDGTLRQTRMITDYVVEPVDLSSKEQELFQRHGVSGYQKERFQYEDLTGTLAVIKAGSWHGHHHPEQCLKGNGFSIEKVETHFISSDFPVKLITVKNSGIRVVYWFMSKGKITDDYGSRVWGSLLRPQSEWVMVTLYFNEPVNTRLDEINRFAGLINFKLNQYLYVGDAS